MKQVMTYEATYKVAVNKFLEESDEWESDRYDYPKTGDTILYLSPHGLVLQECQKPQDYKCLRYILKRKIRVEKGAPVELINRTNGTRVIAYFVEEDEFQYIVTKGMVGGEPWGEANYAKEFWTMEPLSS